MVSPSNYDQLLHSIGQAAQAHVNVERALRDVHITLTSPSLGIYLASSLKGARKLVDENKLMLDKADIDKSIISAGSKALISAKDAEEQRDRMIHDWWINRLEPGKEPVLEQRQIIKGSLHGFKATPRDLSYLKNGIRLLARSYHRINALNHTLQYTLPFYKSSGIISPIPIKFWIQIMNDEFKINKDGSIQVT